MNTRYLTLAIFVTVTLGSLGGLAWMLGALPKPGKIYHLRLDDAGGLVEGNAVRIAGVQVGRIQRMDVDGNEAVLELRIDPRYRIFAEVCASDQIKGMLGEKFLQLRQPKSGEELSSGATIGCVEPSVDMGRALNSLSGVIGGEEPIYPYAVRIMKRLDSLTAAFDESEATPAQGGAGETTGEAKGGTTRQRFDRIMDEVEVLLRTSNGMLAENRDDVRAIVKAVRGHVENPKVEKAIASAERVLSALDRTTPALLESGKRLLADGERVAERLEEVVKAVDDAKIKKIVDDAAESMENMKKASGEIYQVARGAGPLLDDLRKIARKAASINEKVIREFFQIEGFRVRLAVPWGVRGKIKDYVEEEGPASGP